MKLKDFKVLREYFFYLVFENGESGEVNLEELLSSYISCDEVHTAFLNKDWGCLEFKSHTVDIDPKTLYKFFLQNKVSDIQMAS
jgi:hypothetical protein